MATKGKTAAIRRAVGVADIDYRITDHKLFKSEKFSDIVIVCGLKSWNPHRSILSSRCIWFERALTCGLKEAEMQKISIEESNPHHIGLLLEYLYVGQAPIAEYITSGIAKEHSSLVSRLMNIWDLGDFFCLDPLKTLALQTFEMAGSQICGSIQKMNDSESDLRFVRQVKDVYERATPARAPFLAIFQHFIQQGRYGLLKNPKFLDILKDIPQLPYDLLSAMMDLGDFGKTSTFGVCSKCCAAPSTPDNRYFPRIEVKVSIWNQVCELCEKKQSQEPLPATNSKG